MKAAQIIETAEGHNLVVVDIDKPHAGPDEIIVQVHAAGVTPTELIWYPTTHKKDGMVRTNAVPGHEFSGAIAEVGAAVKGFAVGDEVFGMNDWFADGATAEFCVTVPASIGPKPPNLSHTEAAAVPIGALTAWQGLMQRAKLQVGELLLVHGGAGAVGVFAVQLGRMCGAEVIATASSKHAQFLIELGATQVIDYKTEKFEERVRDADVVFDTVGGTTLARSWNVLKLGGRMVTIAADVESSTDTRAKEAFFIVEPDQQQLIEIGDLLNRGELKVFVDTEVPLTNAPEAYAGKTPRGHGYGKVVIVVPAIT